jgi:hypothetical protein
MPRDQTWGLLNTEHVALSSGREAQPSRPWAHQIDAQGKLLVSLSTLPDPVDSAGV